MTDFSEIWSYLAGGPLLWLTATLIAYSFGDWIAAKTGRAPWANPVLVAVIALGVMLWATGTSYATYFEGAQFVHFLLGPATVALAVPLWQQRMAMRRALVPIAAALLAGSVTAVLSALAIGHAMGLPRDLLATLAPKSTTAPVALGISENVGGSPTLTVVLVIMTGMIGAILVSPLMNALGIRDWRARGLAVGVASHGIGTARALLVHPRAGAFAAIGTALNAMLTAVLAPWALGLF
jgi:predicted murein hydrolase (TIGR00659 family)